MENALLNRKNYKKDFFKKQLKYIKVISKEIKKKGEKTQKLVNGFIDVLHVH